MKAMFNGEPIFGPPGPQGPAGPQGPQGDSAIPVGGIIIWSGASNAIPSGWHLCDGTNGTPDLRNRFVLGAGSSYSVAATGGEARHTLTVNEMPSHTHENRISATGASAIDDRFPSGYGKTIMSNAYLSGPTGGGASHNNMPPYYALCYIMKIN